MDYYISTDAWARFYCILKQIRFLHTRNEEATRRFIEAIFFIARSGAQWRLLPPIYGHWRSVYRRYKAWANHCYKKDSSTELCLGRSTGG